MKDKFTHICFVIDESGSMHSSREDVIGGFKQIVEKQKEDKNGECAVSMYTFDGTVTKHFLMKDLNEIQSDLDYSPMGSTALNDAVGQAITEVGEVLAAMPEEERPSSNLIVIMTDGGENSSRYYTLSKVRDMIKHQTEKYNWTFTYMGADITSSDIADDLGIKYRAYSSKADLSNTYYMLNNVISSSRSATATEAAAVLDEAANTYANSVTTTFNIKNNLNLKSV